MAYPVLDDRSALRTDRDHSHARLYTPKGHLQTWRSYLGHEPGESGIVDYAAPGRRTELSGLPPAWIGVTTHDVLYDEGVAYAHRLNECGVPCDLHIVEGDFTVSTCFSRELR